MMLLSWLKTMKSKEILSEKKKEENEDHLSTVKVT
ncbi:unnamed protein product [Brugia timori]|uniref:Uncharacterized protein n=1 Tax=Brugia timori TaxID=42155 RepID=A0A0R3QHD3_9BILA|nr:unnamed protein product [Brugia timori]